MALRDCPECGKMISDKAERCPHCGVDPRKERENVAPERKPVEATTAYGSNEPNNGSGGGKKKLWLILVPLILIGVGVAIWVPVYQHKKAEEQARIEQMRQDSIAAVEAELARIEQWRQDSIKAAEDSIKREEEFRLNPRDLLDYSRSNYDDRLTKTLKKLGFERTNYFYSPGGYEETPYWEASYERVFNNRKITLELHELGDNFLIFESAIDKDQFVKDMKALGYKKGTNFSKDVYAVPNKYYFPVTIEGNKIVIWQ
ncbi:MAG: zinc ribbon domain-containing protein [Paramuribaculum sp.]|nr:zinc ribbon domain-containing protein [Paramuribaculum sp.]